MHTYSYWLADVEEQQTELQLSSTAKKHLVIALGGGEEIDWALFLLWWSFIPGFVAQCPGQDHSHIIYHHLVLAFQQIKALSFTNSAFHYFSSWLLLCGGHLWPVQKLLDSVSNEAPPEDLLLKAAAHSESHTKPSIKPVTVWAKVNASLVLYQVFLKRLGLAPTHSFSAAEEQGLGRVVQIILWREKQ